MNTLLDSIKYTQEKKEHQLKNLEESFYIEPNEIYNNFLANKLSTKSTVSLNMEYQSSWYLWKFIGNSFQNNLNYDLLAKSTKLSYCANLLNYFIGGNAPKYKSCVLLRTAIMHLGQMLFLGWDDKAIKYGNLLLKMLEDKYYKGGTKRPIYPWFIIQLFCNWQNIKLNKDKLNIPKSLGIYEIALKNLLTKDTNLIDDIINEMANYHVLNSDEYVKTDDFGNELSAEFVSSDYFIFPMEILMFLLIRRRLGLPEYDLKKNELLSLGINHIPASRVEYPQNDVIDRIFDKLYRENPDYDKI